MILRVLILAVVLTTASTAAPIRVGIYKGVGAAGRYWHTHIHPGSEMIAAMLANPAAAGLQNPVIPSQGFSVTMYGVDTSCAANGCTASTMQKEAFIAALDTLDVVLIPSSVSFGSGINVGAHRDRLRAFWRTKGLISLHQSTDSHGEWASWDSLNAARFQNHPRSERYATVRLDTIGTGGMDSAWRFLNKGLPDTARIFEEWLSFTTNATTIRGYPHVRTTVNVDENSYEGGLDGARAMGDDHPMSWYRQHPEGGRFFYTAIGHRAATFDSVYFFRRQLYNAILWAGGYDITTGVRDAAPASRFSDMVRASLRGKTLHVNVLTDGPHTVEIRGLNGSMATTKRGTGRREYVFANLRPGVHVVAVTTPAGRSSRLMTVP